jgi:6-pyruvoyltetrahydropterin/6-carboxytetrahydropterin synthase
MVRYTIAKQFHFSASHQLDHLPESHPCARLHGHNYVVEVTCDARQLDTDGFVIDYNRLDAFKQYIDNELDHRHLNAVLPRTTAEDIAKHLYDVAAQLIPARVVAVAVSETDKTWAEYRRHDD